MTKLAKTQAVLEAKLRATQVYAEAQRKAARSPVVAPTEPGAPGTPGPPRDPRGYPEPQDHSDRPAQPQDGPGQAQGLVLEAPADPQGLGEGSS